MMIHTLSIELVGAPRACERFVRVVEVPGEWRLGDLQYLILQLLAFDDEHASEFYVANQAWSPHKLWYDAEGRLDDQPPFDDDFMGLPFDKAQIVQPSDGPAEPASADEPAEPASADGFAGPSIDAIYPLPKHKKLYFLHDFGASWRFEIRRKSRARPAVAGVEYPRVVLEDGAAPAQYPAWEDWEE